MHSQNFDEQHEHVCSGTKWCATCERGGTLSYLLQVCGQGLSERDVPFPQRQHLHTQLLVLRLELLDARQQRLPLALQGRRVQPCQWVGCGLCLTMCSPNWVAPA